jgi:tripartite-type tricarboxylate transporter receptor subunit TctC
MMTRRRILAAAFVGVLLSSAAANAEAYPDRMIKVVVPTGAGGAADIISRLVADKLQASLGKHIVIENKPGANGNTGAESVLASPADGYTAMMGHIGLMTVNRHLYRNMSFKPLTEFAPVAAATTYPIVLVVNPKLPVHSLKDLIAYAKARPGALNYSSAGFGGSFHMATEMLKKEAGIDLVHVPYTGTALALTAVMSGQVEMTFTDVLVATPQVTAGSVRAIAVSGHSRIARLPDIPTASESGLPNFDIVGWNGFVVKAGTPADRIAVLNEHINRALKERDVAARIAELGADVAGGTTERFGQFMAAEDKRWGDLVRDARITTQ